MSKFARFVGKVAGVVAAVALVGSGIGAALGGTMMFTALGSSIAASTIATVAGAVSAIATTVSSMTAKPPAARGQLQSRVFGSNSPLPYAIGRTYVPGVQLAEIAWGGKVGKVWNPYKFIPVVYSCAGPVQSIDAYLFDYAAVGFSGNAATGYYSGFLYRDQQLGASPEADALAPQWSGCPNWGSDYKLSGLAAIGWSFKFDKDGKVFASGIPQFGVVGHWVKTYDARQDSTFPGGSGSHRIDNEATWAWSESPAQHAVAYAIGRIQNGKMIFGPGLEATGIDLGAAVAWDNVCDANSWTIGGTVLEPGDSWNNLKLICQAGGCEPRIGSDGILSFKYQAPRVSLGRIKAEHIKGDGAEVAGGRTYRERYNKIVPKFRSEANQWTYVQGTAQKVDAFITADGEEIETELQYDLVQKGNQAAELALYEIWQRREPGPFSIPLGPEFQIYEAGDTLTLDEDAGLWIEGEDIDLVVLNRVIDPLTGLVSFEFEGENPDKHVAVIGATAAAPPTAPVPTGEERDGAIGPNMDPVGYDLALIQTSYISGVGGVTLTSADVGSTASITVASHSRAYPDKTVAVTGASAGTAFAFATQYFVYYDDAARAGGAVAFQTTTVAADAVASDANPTRHFVGEILTATNGGGSTGGGGGAPPGWGGITPGSPIP